MGKGTDLGLLDLLKSKGGSADALTALAARTPAHEPADAPAADREAKLNEVISRIQQLAGGEAGKTDSRAAKQPQSKPTPSQSTAASKSDQTAEQQEFIPLEPPTIREAGLTDSEVEALILKYLLSRGDSTGRDISD